MVIKEASDRAASKGILDKISRHIKPDATKRIQEKLPGKKEPLEKIKNTRRGQINNPMKVGGQQKGTKRRRKSMGITINDQLISTLEFFSENVNKTGQELQNIIETYNSKKELFKLVDHILQTSLGGWTLTEGHYINTTGHIASPKYWDLHENGKLYPKQGKRIVYNLDKLHEWRELCRTTQ